MDSASVLSNEVQPNTTTTIPVPFLLSDLEWRQRLHTVTIFNFIGVCGFFLNLLPILLTFCTHLRRKTIHILVASLSTADLVCCLTFVTSQWRYIMYREQIDPEPCRWIGFVSFAAFFYAFSFPAFLAVNRYVSLFSTQQQYKRLYSPANIRKMIVGWWAFCIVVPLIFALGGKTGFDEDNQLCCITIKTTSPAGWTVFYWSAHVIPLIAICDGTMVFCNYKIYVKLRNHATAAASRTPLTRNVVRRHMKVVYFVIIDTLVPVCIYSVYQISKFAWYDRTDIVQRRVFTCIYLLNSCIRGAITLTMLRPYRRALANACGSLVVRCSRWRANGEAGLSMNPRQPIGSLVVVRTQNGRSTRVSRIL